MKKIESLHSKRYTFAVTSFVLKKYQTIRGRIIQKAINPKSLVPVFNAEIKFSK